MTVTPHVTIQPVHLPAWSKAAQSGVARSLLSLGGLYANPDTLTSEKTVEGACGSLQALQDQCPPGRDPPTLHLGGRSAGGRLEYGVLSTVAHMCSRHGCSYARFETEQV